MPSSINTPPSSAMFFVKLIISAMRCAGSAMSQKLCITGETPTRKTAMQSAPMCGTTPNAMLAARENQQTGRQHGELRQWHTLERGVLRHRLARQKMVDTAVDEIAAEDDTAE